MFPNLQFSIPEHQNMNNKCRNTSCGFKNIHWCFIVLIALRLRAHVVAVAETIFNNGWTWNSEHSSLVSHWFFRCFPNVSRKSHNELQKVSQNNIRPVAPFAGAGRGGSSMLLSIDGRGIATVSSNVWTGASRDVAGSGSFANKKNWMTSLTLFRKFRTLFHSHGGSCCACECVDITRTKASTRNIVDVAGEVFTLCRAFISVKRMSLPHAANKWFLKMLYSQTFYWGESALDLPAISC